MIKANNSVEWAVLGSMMHGGSVDEFYSKLKPADFSAHLQPIANCLFDAFTAGQQLDFVSVAERLSQTGEAEEYDWHSIGQLVVEGFFPASVIPEHIRLVKQSAKRRRLHDLARALLSNEMDPDAAAEYAISQLQGDELDRDSLYDMRRASIEYLRKLDDRIENPGIDGLSTGFRDLDFRLMGLKPGKLIVLAGRPSMGKSTLARNIALHNAADGKTVLIFSLEMPADEVTGCLIAAKGSINGNHLAAARLTNAEYSGLTGAVSVLKDSRLFIDDDSSLTPGKARARCHEIKRKFDLHLVIIDYLQLMKCPSSSRLEEISEISRSLKRLAKDMSIPVIALSQLNRSVEQRPNKRPVNSDLRESGQIEQDADVIWFCYRDKHYDEATPFGDVAEIITGKFRGGKTGTDFLLFEGEHSRFADLTHGYQPPAPQKVTKAKRKSGMEV